MKVQSFPIRRALALAPGHSGPVLREEGAKGHKAGSLFLWIRPAIILRRLGFCGVDRSEHEASPRSGPGQSRGHDAACDAVEPLSALAWEYAGEFGIPGRLYFRKHENGRRTHHLHLGVRNGRGWHQTIRFRDYLRAHPEAAAEYARIKRGLAAADREDVAAYPYRKSPFIRATLAKAAAEDQGASR